MTVKGKAVVVEPKPPKRGPSTRQVAVLIALGLISGLGCAAALHLVGKG